MTRQITIPYEPQGTERRYNRPYQHVPPQGLEVLGGGSLSLNRNDLRLRTGLEKGLDTLTITQPSSISGLQAWFKGDVGVSDTGGLVDTWADQSGNGNDATASGSLRPSTNVDSLDGKNVITFGGSQYMTIPYASGLNPEEFEIFVVGEYSTISANDSFITTIQNFDIGGFNVGTANTTNLGGMLSDGAGNAFSYYNSFAGAINTPYVLNLNHDDTKGEFLIDRIFKTTISRDVNYDSNIGVTIGAFYTGGFSPLNGKIGDIIFYSRKLLNSEREQVYRSIYLRYPSLTNNPYSPYERDLILRTEAEKEVV